MSQIPAGRERWVVTLPSALLIAAFLAAGTVSCGTLDPAGATADTPAPAVVPSVTPDVTGPSADPVMQAPTPARLQGLTLSTGDLVPAFDPTVTEYTATALGSLFPVDVTATADVTSSIVVNGAAVKTGAPASIALAPRQDLVVAVDSSSGASRSYTVHYLPAGLPQYSVTKTDPAKAGTESILLTPGSGWLLVTNRDGNPLYYRNVASRMQATARSRRISTT